MNWERTTLSSRRVVVAAFAAAVLLGMLAGGVASSTGRIPDSRGTDVRQSITGVGDTAGASVTDAPDGDGLRATRQLPTAPREPPPDDGEVVQAQQLAADFAAGYASFRYDEPPDAVVRRVRELVTPQLAERLARAAGGANGRRELAERQHVAAAVVETVHTQAVGAGWLDVLVVVRQGISSTDGAQTRWPSYLVRVERTSRGWRVAGFQP